ncbi:hypothetical protein [Rhodomicrobium vannielii]|uniref:hypothetical protein n=1 Tax=Rhodomicrobium vannielii TaxID=1069 RepID=UPI0012DEDBE2|nr:hypothetical protein [Rhodomicrobium vannielii]
MMILTPKSSDCSAAYSGMDNPFVTGMTSPRAIARPKSYSYVDIAMAGCLHSMANALCGSLKRYKMFVSSRYRRPLRAIRRLAAENVRKNERLLSR